MTRILNAAAAGLLALLLAAPQPVRAADDPAIKAAALVAETTDMLEKFLAHPQWESVRNVLGGARAVYLTPNFVKAALIVGFGGGDGVLVRRHGASWGDPVFITVRAQSVGVQLGGAEADVVMLIMTDSGVEDLLHGVAKVGASGGFALGSLGVGSSAAGGISGGLQMLTATTNSGLFAGGGLGRTEMVPTVAYNTAVYGADRTLTQIAAWPPSGKPVADKLQKILNDATEKAWALNR